MLQQYHMIKKTEIYGHKIKMSMTFLETTMASLLEQSMKTDAKYFGMCTLKTADELLFT